MSPTNLPAQARAVLDYWLGDGQHGQHSDWPDDATRERWFNGGAAVDAEIEARFGPLVQEACDGGLAAWEPLPADPATPPLARLALLIVLDQFTRNVRRGQGSAFAGDARAQHLAAETVAAGRDETLPWAGRVFCYMPLMHAEHLPLQDLCVARFAALCQAAPPPLRERFEGHLRYAEVHRDIVARFGRFPHRNVALGRTSSGEELAFLEDGPRFGQ